MPDVASTNSTTSAPPTLPAATAASASDTDNAAASVDFSSLVTDLLALSTEAASPAANVAAAGDHLPTQDQDKTVTTENPAEPAVIMVAAMTPIPAVAPATAPATQGANATTTKSDSAAVATATATATATAITPAAIAISENRPLKATLTPTNADEEATDDSAPVGLLPTGSDTPTDNTKVGTDVKPNPEAASKAERNDAAAQIQNVTDALSAAFKTATDATARPATAPVTPALHVDNDRRVPDASGPTMVNDTGGLSTRVERTADTSWSKAPEMTIPLSQPGWEGSLAQRVVWLANQKIQSAEVQVSPPELGPIQIHIRLDNDQASVVFGAAQSHTREALQSALPQLRDLLNQHGLALADVNVSHREFSQARDNAMGWTPAGGAADANPNVSEITVVREHAGMLDVYA